MKNFYKIIFFGLIILNGCSNNSKNDYLAIDPILKNRYDGVLQTIEEKNILNSYKNEKLYLIAVDIYKNSKFIIDNIENYDESINADIIKSIDKINKIQIQQLGEKKYNRNIILKNSENLKENLRNKNQRIKVVNYLLSDNYYFLNEMVNRVGEHDITFNSFKPMILEKKNTVKVGQIYTSEIFLSSFDTTQAYTVLIGESDSIYFDISGKATYRRYASKIGRNEYNGSIKIKKNDGYVMTIPFKEDFYVEK